MKLVKSRENFKRTLGIFISLIGCLSFLGWLIDLRVLASYGKELIPMSPDTALIFIFWGLIIFTNAYISAEKAVKNITIFLIVMFSIYGFLKLAEDFIHLDLTFANFLFPTTEKLGSFTLKRMSPITGLMFFLSGISFLIKTYYGECKRTNDVIGLTGVVVMFIGFTALLGYIFQTPLLYGSKIIPLSLSTAICFLLLGISVLLLGGKKTFITKHFVGNKTQTILVRTIIPILFFVILLQALILKIFNDYESINYAFLSAVFSLLFIIVTSVILINISRVVFKNTVIAEAKSKQAETALKTKDELLKLTGELAKVGGWEYNPISKEIAVTDEVVKIYELKSEKEFNEEIFYKAFDNVSKTLHDNALEKALKESISYDLELNIVLDFGKQKCIRIIGSPVIEDSEVIKVRGIIQDVTDDKEDEKKQRLTATILAILNRPKEWPNLIHDILLEIKKFLNIEAIAIRIQNGVDFPYYQSNGFPDDFINESRPICSFEDGDELAKNQHRNSLLECYCGAVISENTDSTKSYYTLKGSYWTNSTTKFLESTPKSDLPFKFRNRCNINGYESIALIPLRSNNKIIGLLQLNDTRVNLFTPEIISFLEEIGSMIGIAFERIQSENQIKESEKQFRIIFESAAVGVALIETSSLKPIEINKKYCHILGYMQEEMLSINFQDITFEDDRSESQDYRNKLLNGALNEYSITKRYYHKNGSIVWVNQFVSSIFDSVDTRKYHVVIVEDITNQKIIENALKDSEEHFRSITQTAGDAIISIDENGKIVSWNNAATTIFGYSNEEAIGQDIQQLIVPQELQNDFEHGYQNIIKPGEVPIVSKTLEVNGLKKDGSKIPVELSISSFTKNGKWHATGIIRDITERKNSEWAIRERVKEIQCLQSISRITDKENLTTGKFFNRVVNLISSGFQYPQKTECRIVLKDQTFQSSSFVTSQNRLSADLVARNKTIGIIEIFVVGEFLDSTKFNFLKEEKELLFTISKILCEFVERKRRELIQKIIYNSSIAVDTSESLADLVDYIKNQIGLLFDTTNFFAAFYDEETDSISLPYHHDQKDILTKFPAGKTLTKHVIRTRKPLLATNKQIRELETKGVIESYGGLAEVWLGVPLIVNGKVTGIFAVQSYEDENAYDMDDMEIFEFISRQVSISIERKKVEQDLKAAYLKAKESDRLKSTFLATMSHELRTPLNAVIGFSEMMQSDMEANKIPEYAGIINNSGLHLLEIIEDIFDITLLESGEVKVSKSDFIFKSLLDDIQVMLYVEKVKMEKQSLEIRYNPSPELEELTLNTDKSKLKQILVNLLKNALKFTLQGYIEFGFRTEIVKDNQVILFYVKDTGIGIRNEDTEIIFENFRQVDDTNTRLFGGTGIGLSVAKRYSEMLGGKIWVESKYGVGSTFYFTIPHPEPAVKYKLPRIEINPLSPPKFVGKTILIAEDEISNYELLIVYLEELEVNTLWAKDGEEAVSFCESNKEIDLVLMDIKMPRMNGLDATTIIKKSRPNLPIIAQTAFVLLGDDQKAFEAGCNDYIGKPIKRKDLYSLLAKYLQS